MGSENDIKIGPVLLLGDNQVTILKLSKKKLEYMERLKRLMNGFDHYKSPEYIKLQTASNRYKILIIENLLKNKQISTFDLADEIQTKDGVFDTKKFNNACAVINDYIQTGGQNNIGGSGF